MENFSRIFNLGGKQYLYTCNTNPKDEISSKTISKRTYNNELNVDTWTPLIEKKKYGDNAFTRENFKTREVVFADNLLRSSTFNVSKQLDGNHYNDIFIGKIKHDKIIPASSNKHDLSLLKKIKGMIKKF